MTGAILVLLAWGVLAFGAPYPWAYWPLVAGAAALGVWGLAHPKFPIREHRWLILGLAIVAVAIGVQMIPLPRSVLLQITPATDSLLQELELPYSLQASMGQEVTHAISIHPFRTATALTLFAGLSLFLLGLTHILDGGRLRKLVPRLVLLGVVVALIGIIQRPLFDGKVYGFWTPLAGAISFSAGGGPFGPFVNRNHFAGWMLMVLPLAIAYWVALIERGMQGNASGWRNLAGWLSTKEANQAILVSFGIIVMGLSLVMTLSRSGLACFVASLVLFAGMAFRASPGKGKRTLIVAYLTLMVIVSVGWSGLAASLSRFEGAYHDREFRIAAWQDSLQIVNDFPWSGTGVNTYSDVMLVYQTYKADVTHLAQAHSDYLQLVTDGGVLVGLPVVIAIACLVWCIRTRFTEARDDQFGMWIRRGAVTGLVAIGLQETIEFSLQMPGNAILFALLCAIAIRPAGIRSRQQPSAAGSRAHDDGR